MNQRMKGKLNESSLTRKAYRQKRFPESLPEDFKTFPRRNAKKSSRSWRKPPTASSTLLRCEEILELGKLIGTRAGGSGSRTKIGHVEERLLSRGFYGPEDEALTIHGAEDTLDYLA